MSGGGSSVVSVPGWELFSWLRHGFSTRHGGVSTVYYPQDIDDKELSGKKYKNDLNLGWTKDDDPANVAENRRRLVAAVTGQEQWPLVTLRQVHSAVSLVLPEPEIRPLSEFVGSEGRALLETDGLMTGKAGVLLGIQTADCVPVFVVDTKLRVVAGFHAGWRGTGARIVERGVAQMAAAFGSDPADMVAAVGPSIGACCYSVGDAVRESFTMEFSYGESLFARKSGSGDTLYLDLWEANRRQLLDAGVTASEISVIGQCTGCTGLPGRRKYFSHRCEHGFTGRMMNVIGVAR